MHGAALYRCAFKLRVPEPLYARNVIPETLIFLLFLVMDLSLVTKFRTSATQ